MDVATAEKLLQPEFAHFYHRQAGSVDTLSAPNKTTHLTNHHLKGVDSIVFRS